MEGRVLRLSKKGTKKERGRKGGREAGRQGGREAGRQEGRKEGRKEETVLNLSTAFHSEKVDSQRHSSLHKDCEPGFFTGVL